MGNFLLISNVQILIYSFTIILFSILIFFFKKNNKNKLKIVERNDLISSIYGCKNKIDKNERYYKLAISLASDEIVKLKFDGDLTEKYFTKKEIFIKIIELDPNYFKAYYGLSCEIKVGEWIPIGLKKYNKKDLLIKVMELNKYFSNSYYSLAIILDDSFGENQENTFEIPNFGKVTKKHLLLLSIRYDPRNYLAYSYLASVLKDGENIVAYNSESLNKNIIKEKLLNLNKNFQLLQ